MSLESSGGPLTRTSMFAISLAVCTQTTSYVCGGIVAYDGQHCNSLCKQLSPQRYLGASARQLLDEGAAGPYLLTMVARQARLVALAQELLARRAPPQEWPARLGTSSDFVVRKTMEQARRFPPHAVRALYRLLLDTDLALKSGTSDELALTEMLCAGVDAAGRAIGSTGCKKRNDTKE